jgi:ADP-heptose:LPS heptosyltransferase
MRAFASRRPKSRSGDRDVSRILVVELWNIGDLVLAMPFLAQLRVLFPRAKISLLAKPIAGELLSGTGLVDEVIPADMAFASYGVRSASKIAIDVWRTAKKLRVRDFDLAFSSRLHIREQALLAFSGARRTVGYPVRNNPQILTDPVATSAEAVHKVQSWMQLLAPFGGAGTVLIPRLHVSDVERLSAKGYLASLGLKSDELLVGLHPGASLEQKRWPLEAFREVAESIAKQPALRVVIFAEPTGFGAELGVVPGVVSVRVPLRELIALIAQCDLLICNDSGPMHIAGALGVPTVAMFGAGIGPMFGPLGENHALLQPDSDTADGGVIDGIRSPAGIRPAQVIQAVGKAVQRLRERRTLSEA